MGTDARRPAGGLTTVPPGAGIEVELITRSGCHLCDVALVMLRAEAERRPLRIVLRDVDADPDLLRRYDLRVPVVRSGGRELCEGMIMPLRLRTVLDEAAGGAG